MTTSDFACAAGAALLCLWLTMLYRWAGSHAPGETPDGDVSGWGTGQTSPDPATAAEAADVPTAVELSPTRTAA